MADDLLSLSCQLINLKPFDLCVSSKQKLCHRDGGLLYACPKREFLFKSAVLGAVCLTNRCQLPFALAESSSSSKSFLSGISNTRDWFQFYGDGFSIRVPPEFQDVMEPEDFNAGSSFYGDKVKPKTFAARFSSPDGSEVVSVIIRPTNQLKITFLEAKDIVDLGSLKEAAKIFVPGGASLYNARTIKVKDEEKIRTYYFYEFLRDEQHVALAATVDGGKAFIAAAVAPQPRWNEDGGVKLRSSAISLAVL